MAQSSIHPTIHQIVLQIFAHTPTPKFVVFAASGGAKALSWLTCTEGASQCLLECSIPYSRSATKELINWTDDTGYCSQSAIEKMTRKAYERAFKLAFREGMSLSEIAQSNIIGVACSASLVSSYPKYGPHKCFIGTESHDNACYHFLEMGKGARTRDQEEHLVSSLVLNAICESLSIQKSDIVNDQLLKSVQGYNLGSNGVVSECLVSDDGPHSYSNQSSSAFNSPLDRLLNGSIESVLYIPSHNDSFTSLNIDPNFPGFVPLCDVFPDDRILVYSGSFNPLHQGHVLLAEASRKYMSSKFGKNFEIVFELAIKNADKPVIERTEIIRRVNQFRNGEFGSYPIVLTKRPLFHEKTQIFNNVCFIIGADTAIRLLDQKYYHNNPLEMVQTFASIQGSGSTFIVGGRKNSNGVFLTGCEIIEQSIMPEFFQKLFHCLSESEFRIDLSSTEIRSKVNL